MHGVYFLVLACCCLRRLRCVRRPAGRVKSVKVGGIGLRLEVRTVVSSSSVYSWSLLLIMGGGPLSSSSDTIGTLRIGAVGGAGNGSQMV